MLIPKTYDPSLVEQKWYDTWLEKKSFRSIPDEREAYTIVIPPPNVTGILHMGHMLNNTIQDIFIRRARKQGYNACWVPGTDHASIATEAKVVKMLAEKGIKKSDIGREKFLEYAWEWTDKYGGIIIDQLKKLGASCDWDRECFTLDEIRSKSVLKVFVDLYQKGHIYRGVRMTNWDPKALTALSDEEVYHKEEQSKLYHIRYQVEGTTDEWVTIATTRPETILGDTAICFHPEDERYTSYAEKKALIPLLNRAIPFIYDEYVTMEFGTGALKVTPAHDSNDYILGEKHNLPTVDILNANGTLSEAAQLYVGEDRFAVRKKIVKELEEKGHIVKIEEIANKVGYSERTDVAIEPRLTKQWFVSMKKLAEPALKAVMEDDIIFVPARYKNTYNYWMSNVRDWCISRQLWWGQRIPAFYYSDKEEDFVVAETAEEALTLAQEKSGNSALTLADLRQEEDVVDTWFSSWLWPISVFDGMGEGKEELDYYYPTNMLVTGWDIIFFWVARMIVAGYEWQNEMPFKRVYFTGMVRDMKRRKMSKSLGNSPDALALIERFGADGVRLGLLLSSPAGGDLLFEEKLCEQGRNFSNKIWNALRFVKSLEVAEGKNEDNTAIIEWFDHKLSRTISEIENLYDSCRLSEIVKTLYSFVWNDFCSSYIEMVKPDYQQAIDQHTYDQTIVFFEKLMGLLHPIMPFITEEIYSLLKERAKDDLLVTNAYPAAGEADKTKIALGEVANEITSKVRDIRTKQALKQRAPLKAYVKAKDAAYYAPIKNMLLKKAYLECFEAVEEEQSNMMSFIANQDNFFIDTGVEIDVEQEKDKLLVELKYLEGFAMSIQKKLSNERFVNNAPAAVVDKERKKLSDSEEKMQMIRDNLAQFEMN